MFRILMTGCTISNKACDLIIFWLMRIVAGGAGHLALLKTFAWLQQLHLFAMHIRFRSAGSEMRIIKIRQCIARFKCKQWTLYIKIIPGMAGSTHVQHLLPGQNFLTRQNTVPLCYKNRSCFLNNTRLPFNCNSFFNWSARYYTQLSKANWLEPARNCSRGPLITIHGLFCMLVSALTTCGRVV